MKFSAARASGQPLNALWTGLLRVGGAPVQITNPSLKRVSQKTRFPSARIAFKASLKYGVDFASSSPTCSTYSSQLFKISSRNSVRSVPRWSARSLRSRWYATISDTSARAIRRARVCGSDRPNTRGPAGVALRSGADGSTGACAASLATGAGGDASLEAGGAGSDDVHAGPTGMGGAGSWSAPVPATVPAGGASSAGGAMSEALAQPPRSSTPPSVAGGANGSGASVPIVGPARSTGGPAVGCAAGAVASPEARAGTAGRSPGRRTSNVLRQTEQRARTPLSGTRAGLTRNSVSQEGHLTFIRRPARALRPWMRSPPPRPARPAAGPPRTPSPAGFSRTSSSPLRARSPAPCACISDTDS